MIERLKFLDLSHYESKALNLLLKEKLSIRELSKKAEIPFGKVYSVVKNLKEKGVINETNSRPKLIYIENASEIISKLIEKKQEKNKDNIEYLKQFAAEIDKNRKKTTKFFQIGTSQEDNTDIQLRSFTEAKEEVLQIINIYHKPKSNRERKNLWEREIVNAINRGVVFKAIYPNKTVIPRVLSKLNKTNPNNFQIKRFDTDFVRSDIIDRKKVLIKFVREDPFQFGGILFIENEDLANNFFKIFNEMWEQE